MSECVWRICSKDLCNIDDICDMYDLCNMWYDIYDFSKKQLEVLRLLSRAVCEYESEGELCRQITNNLNKWIFEYSNWRKCQNTDIYYFDPLVSISTKPWSENWSRTVYFFISFCCWSPMLAVGALCVKDSEFKFIFVFQLKFVIHIVQYRALA